MSNQYIYSGDETIIVPEGAIIWNDQSHEQTPLHYLDASDSDVNEPTIIDENYVTAIDLNDTQYFSILEQTNSNDIILEDLNNLTVENEDVSSESHPNNSAPKIDAQAALVPNGENDNAQVIVFSMHGSEDLFGIQLISDSAGNVQKYQFKFRQTPDGQLEPIPETVTLLPGEDQQNNVQSESVEPAEDADDLQQREFYLMQTPLEEHVNFANEQNNGAPCIKGETLSSETVENFTVNAEMLQQLYNKTELSGSIMEDIESSLSGPSDIKEEQYPKPGTEEDDEESDFNETIQNICKEELVHMQQDQEDSNSVSKMQIYEPESPEHLEPPHDTEQFLTAVDNDHEQLVKHFMAGNDQIEVQYETEFESAPRSVEDCEYDNGEADQTEFSSIYLEEAAECITNETELGQYQIVKNSAGDSLGSKEFESTEVLGNRTDQKSNVYRRSLVASDTGGTKKPLLSLKYYVLYPEKENVNSLAGDSRVNSQVLMPKLTKCDPRSVLRNSVVPQKDKASDPAANGLGCDLYHKRFAKNKDAMQAKHFHNFLNRTTIPHAPVRQKRQPRKQEIKPVRGRSDEEIIVQEVIVSSDGFIEGPNKKANNLKGPVAVVELSDSEEDFNTKSKQSHQKAGNLPGNCDLENNIIEIHSDQEEAEDQIKGVALAGSKRAKARNSPVTVKRRRGRPPKNKQTSSEVPKSAVPQHNNLVSTSSAPVSDKQEIHCPFCPKTFPSQNSLNTHIIHHNLENSLKSKGTTDPKMGSVSRQSQLPKFEYKHKCDQCQETFKNSILLQRHDCAKKQSSLCCSVCLKQFRDVSMLNIHKKSHAKSNLVAKTCPTKVSPKKIHSSKGVNQSLGKSSLFKCTECPRVCDTEEKLTAHIKMHRKFVCSSCFTAFPSKVLHDIHLRENCVKPKTGNKRLSFTIRKSFIHTPARRSSVGKFTGDKSVNKIANQSYLLGKLDCDLCDMKFSTFRTLYTHKVQKHGLSTPDKSLLTKPKQGIYKPRPAHGGIPINDRLKKALADLRKKLSENQSLKVQ